MALDINVTAFNGLRLVVCSSLWPAGLDMFQRHKQQRHSYAMPCGGHKALQVCLKHYFLVEAAVSRPPKLGMLQT
jgi:hypothetical protein